MWLQNYWLGWTDGWTDGWMNKRRLNALPLESINIGLPCKPFSQYKNSAEGVVAPAGAKVTGATIRTWLFNKFISFLAVLSWKKG